MWFHGCENDLPFLKVRRKYWTLKFIWAILQVQEANKGPFCKGSSEKEKGETGEVFLFTKHICMSHSEYWLLSI